MTNKVKGKVIITTMRVFIRLNLSEFIINQTSFATYDNKVLSHYAHNSFDDNLQLHKKQRKATLQ